MSWHLSNCLQLNSWITQPLHQKSWFVGTRLTSCDKIVSTTYVLQKKLPLLREVVIICFGAVFNFIKWNKTEMFGNVILQEFNSSFWTFTKFSSPIFSPWPTAFFFSTIFKSLLRSTFFGIASNKCGKSEFSFLRSALIRSPCSSHVKTTCEIVKGQG